MSFEVDEKQDFIAQLNTETQETEKIPRYTVTAENNDLYLEATKENKPDGTRESITWDTNNQIYDFAQYLIEQTPAREDQTVKINYIDSQDNIYSDDIALTNLTDGWQQIEIGENQSKTIDVYELTTAVTEIGDYEVFWNQGLIDPETMGISYETNSGPENPQNWIKDDRTDLESKKIEEIFNEVQEKIDNHLFEQESSSELEVQDLLE